MRSICITLLAGAALAAGCAQILGIEELSLPPDAAPVDSMVPPDAPECLASTDCAATTPICHLASGTCRSCQEFGGDDACAMRDEATPFCADDGTCVGCLDNTDCSEAAPVCDDSNTCSACKEHSDCADYSGVCDRDNGTCVPAADIIYVTQGGLDTATCDAENPCGSIEDALALVSGTRHYIRLDDQEYPAHLSLRDMQLSIIGDGASISGFRNDDPVINVAGNVEIMLEGVVIASTGTNAVGVRCVARDLSSSMQLVNVTVRNNAIRGIESVQCRLVVSHSRISSNSGGGVFVLDSALSLTNNYILDNGGPNALTGGVEISNTVSIASQVLAFNTILGNDVQDSRAASGVSCTTDTNMIATSNIVYENTGAPAVAGNCTWKYSNIEGKENLGVIASDASNVDADCTFLNGQDDLPRVIAGSPCQDAAEPGTGVDVDYEGDPRPQDTPDIGADEIASGS